MRLPLLLFIPCLFAADPVAHRTPVAASIFPQSARPGDSLEAEILGEHLDRATAAVAPSAALRAEIIESSPTRLRLRLAVSPQAAYGLHPLSIVSPRGASAPVLFRVAGLPHILEAEPNTRLEEAQPVAVPATILGRLNTDRDFDFFRFHARRNDRWLFDLRAARNGNGLDAALILLDTSGRKLAHSEERFIWDPFLDFVFPADGDYIVIVQPTHRNNDPNFAYTLDIRQSPHLDTVAPLALPPGTHEITLYGAGLSPTPNARLEFSLPAITGEILALDGHTARARVTIPPGTPDGPRELTVLTPAGRSNPARFLTDSLPVAAGPSLTAPSQVTAMARYRDPYRFTLHAEAGQSLTFEIRSQRYGVDSDLSLRLLDAHGKQIANNDDFNFAGAAFYTKDPRLTYKFPAAGDYTLEVRNTVAVASEGTPFQLTVTPPRPAFTPQLPSDRLALFPGQKKQWKLSVQRLDGHAAELPIEIIGLPPGVTAAHAVIPAGKNDAEVELTAAADARPGAAAPVEVKIGGQPAWFSARVSSGGGEGAAYVRVDRAIVAVAQKPNFSLEASASAVNVPRGGSARIPVMIRREPGFLAPIAFRLENLPAGVTMEPITVGPELENAEITIRASAESPRARAPRVAVLGVANEEQQEAPRLSVLVD